jgi:hypothetical protein
MGTPVGSDPLEVPPRIAADEPHTWTRPLTGEDVVLGCDHVRA